jgi:hypothetical protein
VTGIPLVRANGDKSVDFGLVADVISGSTVREQEADLRRVISDTAAHLVVYGYLSDNPDDPDSLNLDFNFYYVSDAIRQNPDAVSGQYILGKSIAVKREFDPQKEPNITQSLTRQIWDRARALFWITVGLGQDADALQRQDAYDTFQQAKAELAGLNDKELQGLLSYFSGRQALWLGQYITATNELTQSLKLIADFPNAYHTLALVHFDQAQLTIAYPDGAASVPAEQAACFSKERLDGRADESEVDAHLKASLELLKQAIESARERGWHHTEHISRLTLGLVQRMQAQSWINRDNPEAALAGFINAEETLKIALAGFAGEGKDTYVGWSHLGLGLTYQYRGPAEWNIADIEGGLDAPDERAVEVKKEIAWLDKAIQQYDKCITQDVRDNTSYETYIVDCGCKYYQAQAVKKKQGLLSELR